MSDGNRPDRCILICRACEGDPLVMPFASQRERGRWAAQHTAGTGHQAWFCLDGWPSPAEAIERLRRHDEQIKEMRRLTSEAIREARS